MALAAGQGAVWLARQNLRGSGGVLVRLSPSTNTVVESIPLPSKPSGIEIGPQTVWITAQLRASPTLRSAQGAVYVVDPSRSRIIARSRAPFVPLQGRTSFAVSADAAWIAGADGARARLDPRTAALTHVVRTPLATDAVTASAGSVWAAADGGVIYRLDPRTGAVLDRIGRSRAGLRPTDILATSGRLWLTLGPPQTLRTNPLVSRGQLQASPSRRRKVRRGSATAPAPSGRARSPSAGCSGSIRRQTASSRRCVPAGEATSLSPTAPSGRRASTTTPSTGSIRRRILSSHGSRRRRCAAGDRRRDGAVWVANHYADSISGDRTGSVVRIDPQRNRVVAKIPLGARNTAAAPTTWSPPSATSGSASPTSTSSCGSTPAAHAWPHASTCPTAAANSRSAPVRFGSPPVARRGSCGSTRRRTRSSPASTRSAHLPTRSGTSTAPSGRPPTISACSGSTRRRTASWRPPTSPGPTARRRRSHVRLRQRVDMDQRLRRRTRAPRCRPRRVDL